MQFKKMVGFCPWHTSQYRWNMTCVHTAFLIYSVYYTIQILPIQTAPRETESNLVVVMSSIKGNTDWNQSSQARVCVPGMLLELPGPVLSQMVQDKATLTAGVEKALGALQLAKEPRYSNGDGVAKPDLLPPSCSLVLVCGFSKSSFLSQMNSQQRSEVVFRCRRTKSFKSEEMSLCGSVCPWRQHQLCIILVTRNTW